MASDHGAAADDLVGLARRELVEPELLPLLLGIWRGATRASCLAIAAVCLGMVVVPAAATAVLFLVPELAATWLRFAGLVTAMVVATALLVSLARRARVVLAERSAARRVRLYNERSGPRVRRLAAALEGEPAAEDDGETLELLRSKEARLVRLVFLAVYRHPLRRRPAPARGAGASVLESRLLGLALWVECGAELRPLASFVAVVPPGAELETLDPLARFAELPAEDLVRAARRRSIEVDDRRASFELP